MPSLLDIAWLIPFAPFAGAFLIWALLISFNRTMNRLSKPVSYLLALCVALSTGLSFALFEKDLSGQLLNWDLNIASKQFHIALYVDRIASLTAAICGLVVLTMMLFSYYLMERKKGYVLYFVLLGVASGSISAFTLSGDLFHKLF